MAPSTAEGPRLAVVGIEHLHLFELVASLTDAGAHPVCHAGSGSLTESYHAWQTGSMPLDVDEVWARDDVDLVVIADVPDRRAELTVRALESGHHVVCDKPGVVTSAEVDAVVTAARSTDRRWWVVFGERLGNRAVAEAVRMARDGELGQVVAITGWGPHSLFEASRPDWFWDRRRSGGVLADFGCHQVDQFCAVTDPNGTGSVSLIGAARGNVAHPHRPHFDDVAEITLAAGGVRGTHRVDVFTPDGLGTWGDCRMRIVGTEATAEVRANIDVCGAEGTEHLLVVDHHGARRVDPPPLTTWAELAVADMADGGDRLMSLGHVAQVCRLTARAAETASAWAPS